MKTWTRLLEQLYEHSWNEPLGRFRAPFAFRGLPDIEQLLTNSLTRLAQHHGLPTRSSRSCRRRPLRSMSGCAIIRSSLARSSFLPS